MNISSALTKDYANEQPVGPGQNETNFTPLVPAKAGIQSISESRFERGILPQMQGLGKEPAAGVL